MNLKQQLNEKNFFLRKAYEVAFEYDSSSPLSVCIDPIEFGVSIGFNEIQTERIMIELVNDGYVQSSLGMGMLLVTNLGLAYLREIENDPTIEPSEYYNAQNFDLQKTNKPNQMTMKQSEKLDLILKELYKFKNDGGYHSIGQICNTLGIPLDSTLEMGNLASRLKTDGLINAVITIGDSLAELTSHGIEYCEENSYSYSGHSIITNNYNISVVNSPNSNIVSQSSNVSITQNISEVNQTIEKIRETIATDSTIELSKTNEILECLNEIQECIKNNQKPKYAIKSLLDIAGGISSIASLVMTLGQFAGLIPIPGL